MAHQALSELMEENLVARRIAGRAYLFSLVRGSFLAGIVGPLFQEKASPVEELGKLVKKTFSSKAVISGILYGSVARGEEEAGSDIDLYLVVRSENARATVEELVSKLNRITTSYFGNRVSALVKTVGESRRAYLARRGLEIGVEAEGIVLVGLPMREAVK